MVKKGFTLVETLVSLFLFSLSILTLTTTILLTRRLNLKQHQKTYFQAILYDIDTYLTQYQKNWDKEYFQEEYIHTKEEASFVYYDKDFTKAKYEEEKSYTLEYCYKEVEGKKHLFLSVYDKEERNIYENIDYGYRRIQA